MADSDLNRYNSLFTGRGYIWLESLPILRECLILGKGAGNFPFFFVQNDVIGLCNTDGTYRLVIDKPHSLYLQIAITAGIPALLCILVLFGSFVFRGLRCLWKANAEAFRTDRRVMLMLCLYAGVCGYMVSGLINDSSITVSPVFWLLFGTAYSLCIRMEQGGDEI
jgi:O-antigen ligase